VTSSMRNRGSSLSDVIGEIAHVMNIIERLSIEHGSICKLKDREKEVKTKYLQVNVPSPIPGVNSERNEGGEVHGLVVLEKRKKKRSTGGRNNPVHSRKPGKVPKEGRSSENAWEVAPARGMLPGEAEPR